MTKVVKNQIKYKTFTPSYDGFIGTGEKALGKQKLVPIYEMKTEEMTGKVTRFIGTSEAKDRDGEIVLMDAWDFTNYVKNPVVLWMHDHKALPIGKTVGIYKDEVSRVIYFDIYITDGYDFAKNVKALVEEGILKATSVGFRVLDWTWDEKMDAPVFTKTELFEISIVNVPANQEAVAQEDGKAVDDEDAVTKSAEVAELAGALSQMQSNLERLTQTVESLVTQNSTPKPEPTPEPTPEPEPTTITVGSTELDGLSIATDDNLVLTVGEPSVALAPEVLDAIVRAVVEQINQAKPTDESVVEGSPGEPEPIVEPQSTVEPEPAVVEEPADENVVVGVGDLDELDEFIIINEEEN